jgi:hypothetical protein
MWSDDVAVASPSIGDSFRGEQVLQSVLHFVELEIGKRRCKFYYLACPFLAIN